MQKPRHLIQVASAFLLASTFLLTALPAAGASGTTAVSAASKEATPKKQAKKTKEAEPKKKSVKVHYAKGSGETTAERDRRLLRECKGRPNAGACLGYANQ